MAANITSCHGRDGDLTINLCYKQQLLEGALCEIKSKSYSSKMFTAQMDVPSENSGSFIIHCQSFAMPMWR